MNVSYLFILFFILVMASIVVDIVSTSKYMRKINFFGKKMKVIYVEFNK